MKKEQIFWTSVYLLLNCASAPLSAVAEDAEEYTDVTDDGLPPLKLAHSFCALKADNGPCRAILTKFFFNIHTQQCEEFIYGGCEGNQNRFESLEECEEKCIGDYIKTRTETTLEKEKPEFCFLDEDSGICRGYMTRYFYSNDTKQCERFKYGGCLGNRNNFESLEECKNTCEDAVNDNQLDMIVNNTLLSETTDSILPLYSTTNMLLPESVNSTLPLDSVNNDSFTPQPTNVPSFFEFYGPSWCLTPADRGLCQANVSRFYYNSVIGKCRPFKYSGCGGNENNFTSKNACLRTCKKGFIKRTSKGGLIKTKRKRKKQTVKIGYEKIFVKKI
ncbi:tissue factor pathway inhibitor [Neofelis nebulosa]|uniref:tissue factor pathway inhibitor n=1 Tax=Neofelis nebulosa TaxID=61452 RepID=UPI00272BD8CB|nr:tissue factor pathway inhibitor [Neofelis nebulosa]XP_058567771.1 tissue factor pathway inhibitor [Neofelis nebulosa]XP_058567780.1 tissue factor pathway inhibitor [Neofelis nebulosa]XP_058567790.1 tissue factor pathway inhibitor [Neofelis nebulosa]XP_058567797.1 tissue factor pathway inhibitor [Neofelis nebulosa]XP_058567806.1 tissue factor pathway inhibitor [Neofelis nebulosa]XP_058567815.1 tissue factor pathway inhibitor [Neofelis nebulosa]